MRLPGTKVFWVMLTFATLAALVTTPSLAAAKQEPIEGKFPIDITQVKAAVPLDMPASVFSFKPAEVEIGKPGKTKTVIKVHISTKNDSDTDYYVHLTAVLQDADGKPIASKGVHRKADDHDSASLTAKFKVPNGDVSRVKACTLRFAFERD